MPGTYEREPSFARVRWFEENYGLSRCILLKMVEKEGVQALRTDNSQSGVLLFRVRDVKRAMEKLAVNVKVKAYPRRSRKAREKKDEAHTASDPKLAV